jgi:AraC-like DNA-binding protein
MALFSSIQPQILSYANLKASASAPSLLVFNLGERIAFGDGELPKWAGLQLCSKRIDSLACPADHQLLVLECSEREIKLEEQILLDQTLTSCMQLLMVSRNEASADSAFLKAWGDLFVLRLKQLSARSPHHDSRLSKLDAYIDERLDYPICVDDFCSVLNMPKLQLWRWMKQVTECTPWQYLIKRRLLHAQRLLEHSDMSLVDIALSVGFASQTHFCASFKSVLAQSPGAYRRNKVSELRLCA